MKSILFVCIGNACRSQMAEGWVRHLISKAERNDVQVFSAGSSPLGSIPNETIDVMQEINIDISSHTSKSIQDLPISEFDYVISLCGDRCPFVPADQHIDWPIQDPYGDPIAAYREARDIIRDKVVQLLKEI